MLHKGQILSLIILFLILIPIRMEVFASTFQIQTNKDLLFDSSLISGSSVQFEQVKTVHIVDFTTNDPTLGLSTKEYVQGLYYYLASTYQETIPFTYLVGWDGKIYDGAPLGADSISTDPATVSIAYLDAGDGLTDAGDMAMAYLLTQISTKTGLGSDAISASGFNYSEGSFTFSDANSNWDSTIEGIKGEIKGVLPKDSVAPIYSIKINNIKVIPDGTNQNVSISFTNTSHLSMFGRVYGGSDSPSPLYVPNVWISNTRTQKNEIGVIDSGGNGTISFTITGKTIHGIYSMSLYDDVEKINGSDLSLTVSSDNTLPVVSAVTPVPQKNVVIGNTGTGYLNVHTNPSLYATIITKVKTGASFPLIQSQNGWDEITYDGKNNGWIDAEYTN